MGSTNPEKHLVDSKASLDYLAKQPEVKPGPVAITGYCMGCGVVMRTAGTYPGRIAAAAGFHGGRRAPRAAGVDNEVTIYLGARHGYTMPDLPVYNEEAAERHWTEMLALFDETLKQK